MGGAVLSDVFCNFLFSLKVQKGINEFLFKLLILRYLMDSEGKMWKCSDTQLYLIEILRPAITSVRTPSLQVRFCMIVLQKVIGYLVFYCLSSYCCFPHRMKL